MKTALLPAESADALQLAAGLLRRGEVVACPTDTLYGLAANALDRQAVRRLFEVKTRPPDNPVPIFIARAEDLPRVCREVPALAWPLLRRFWPGALTVVLPRLPELPPELAAGGATIAVRVPDHPTPLALLRAVGFPLTGTSANLSGAPPPATAAEVAQQLGGRIPLILDGGPCPGHLPSTIIDLSVEPPRLLRSGAIPPEALRPFLPALDL